MPENIKKTAVGSEHLDLLKKDKDLENLIHALSEIPGFTPKLEVEQGHNHLHWNLSVMVPAHFRLDGERKEFQEQLKHLTGAKEILEGNESPTIIHMFSKKYPNSALPTSVDDFETWEVDHKIRALTRQITVNAEGICRLLGEHGIDVSAFKGFGTGPHNTVPEDIQKTTVGSESFQKLDPKLQSLMKTISRIPGLTPVWESRMSEIRHKGKIFHARRGSLTIHIPMSLTLDDRAKAEAFEKDLGRLIDRRVGETHSETYITIINGDMLETDAYALGRMDSLRLGMLEKKIQNNGRKICDVLDAHGAISHGIDTHTFHGFGPIGR